VIVLAILLSACGGSNGGPVNSSPSPVPAGTQNSTAVVNVSDAPSDRLVALEVTIYSIALTRSDGSSVSVLSSTRKIEATHIAGTTEGLALSSIPQGTYVGAVISVSSPEIAFINNAGQVVEQENPAFTASVTTPISPALVVGTGPVVLNFDVNAKNSVAIDLVSGNVTFTPTFTVLTASVPPAGQESEEEDQNGAFNHVVGQITAVSATGFTINVGQSGWRVTFKVNSSTRFDNGATFANIVVNSLVRVEGVTQADGSFLANEIEVLGANPLQEAEGIVTTTFGNPVSSFSMLLHDGSGGMVTPGMLRSTIPVQISPSTAFRVDNGDLDINGWSLPQFSPASLSKAQRIEVDGVQNSGGLTATAVKLQQQALTGIISALANSQFTLTLPSDSAFSLLTGMTEVTIYVSKSASIDGVTLVNGATVKVRGLLLLNPSQGSFQFVASGVSSP
jgi:Domain of unknown function (DUF5666)